jgi:hypothetical protein
LSPTVDLVAALQSLRNAVQAFEYKSRRRPTARNGQEREYFFRAPLDFQAEPIPRQLDQRGDDGPALLPAFTTKSMVKAVGNLF